jgi:hypothetical protein
MSVAADGWRRSLHESVGLRRCGLAGGNGARRIYDGCHLRRRRSSARLEQRLHKPRVTGSNPVAAIHNRWAITDYGEPIPKGFSMNSYLVLGDRGHRDATGTVAKWEFAVIRLFNDYEDAMECKQMMEAADPHDNIEYRDLRILQVNDVTESDERDSPTTIFKK